MAEDGDLKRIEPMALELMADHFAQIYALDVKSPLVEPHELDLMARFYVHGGDEMASFNTIMDVITTIRTRINESIPLE